MSKETPKPWVAVPRHGNHDKDEMSGLGWDIEGPPEPMLRGQFALAADARKVAAAQEMLEALELVSEWAACPPGMKAIVQAAIAKARGDGV